MVSRENDLNKNNEENIKEIEKLNKVVERLLKENEIMEETSIKLREKDYQITDLNKELDDQKEKNIKIEKLLKDREDNIN